MTTQARVRSARAAAAGVNRDRRAAAAGRDVPLAQAIALSPVWPELDEPRRRVVAVRAAQPEATWTEIAVQVGMSKDTAYGLWRRVCQLPQVQALHHDEREDRR